MTYTVVFQAGQGGYARYRIPAIVCTADGTLHAFAEGRVGFGGDWGRVDVVRKQSHDGGKTWDALAVMSRGHGVEENPAAVERGFPAGPTCHNPTPIAIGNVVHLLYCVNYRAAFHSVDGEHADITATFAVHSDYPWRVLAIGPGHGIVSDGRMVATAWLSLGTDGPDAHGPSVSTLITSRDGTAWIRGPLIGPADGAPNPNEWAAVDTGAAIVGIVRTDGHRAHTAEKPDGSWHRLMPAGIPGPPCQGSAIRLPSGRHAFSGIVSTPRADLRLRLSGDGCASWGEEQSIHDGPARYSDLVNTPDGLGCLYEFGSQSKGGIAYRCMGDVA